MQVQQTIEELRASLRETEAEGELLSAIDSGLVTLREGFRADRSQFSPEDIAFLRSLSEISGQLRTFVELRQTADRVSSVDEYESLLRQLRAMKDALAAFAVGRRVGATLRQLHSRLPALLERDSSRAEFRRFRGQFRVLEMQRKPRLCAFGHPMVLQERPDGLYWACSRSPECDATADLTPEEQTAAAQRS